MFSVSFTKGNLPNVILIAVVGGHFLPLVCCYLADLLEWIYPVNCPPLLLFLFPSQLHLACLIFLVYSLGLHVAVEIKFVPLNSVHNFQLTLVQWTVRSHRALKRRPQSQHELWANPPRLQFSTVHRMFLIWGQREEELPSPRTEPPTLSSVFSQQSPPLLKWLFY